MRTLTRLFKDKRGATAIEYALIASLMSIAAVVAFENLGTSVDAKYQAVDQAI